MDTPEKRFQARQRKLQRITLARDFAALTLTRLAAGGWADALVLEVPEGRLVAVWEKLVANFAISEWGEGTHCHFDRIKRLIKVEHLDGRQDTLHPVAQVRTEGEDK